MNLHDALDERATTLTPDPGARERVRRRASARRTARRISAGVVGAVIAIGVSSGLWAISRPTTEPGQSPPPTRPPTQSARPATPPAPIPGLEVGLTVRNVGWHVFADPDGVFVGGASAITSVTPQTGATTLLAHADWDYDFTEITSADGGRLVVASGQRVWLVDAHGGDFINTFDVRSLGYVADVFHASDAAGGGVWLTANAPMGNRPSFLAEIDPTTGTIGMRVRGVTGHITEAGGYLFASASGRPRASFVRIDPRTGAVTPIRSLPSGFIEGAGDKLWVANWASYGEYTDTAGEVRCIDAVSFAPCGSVAIVRPAQLAVDGNDLWVLSGQGARPRPNQGPDPHRPGTVTLVDATTGEIIAGPLPLPIAMPSTIEAFGGHAWVGFHDGGDVLRIDRCQPATCAG